VIIRRPGAQEPGLPVRQVARSRLCLRHRLALRLQLLPTGLAALDQLAGMRVAPGTEAADVLWPRAPWHQAGRRRRQHRGHVGQDHRGFFGPGFRCGRRDGPRALSGARPHQRWQLPGLVGVDLVVLGTNPGADTGGVTCAGVGLLVAGHRADMLMSGLLALALALALGRGLNGGGLNGGGLNDAQTVHGGALLLGGCRGFDQAFRGFQGLGGFG
jgi:hypothetical protein